MDDFDKKFNQLWYANIAVITVIGLISLSACGFAVYVILAILKFYGVGG
jgi:preprotein translocase subunit Sss1